MINQKPIHGNYINNHFSISEHVSPKKLKIIHNLKLDKDVLYKNLLTISNTRMIILFKEGSRQQQNQGIIIRQISSRILKRSSIMPPVYSVAKLNDRKLLITNNDNKLRIWDLLLGTTTVMFCETQFRSPAPVISLSSSKFITFKSSNDVLLLNLNSEDEQSCSLIKSQNQLTCMTMTVLNKTHVACGNFNHITIYKIDPKSTSNNTIQIKNQLRKHETLVTVLKLLRFPWELLSISYDGKAIIWDWQRSQSLRTFNTECHNTIMCSLIFKENIIFLINNSKCLECWDLTHGIRIGFLNIKHSFLEYMDTDQKCLYVYDQNKSSIKAIKFFDE